MDMGTICSGFEGVGVGAKEAGLTLRWGIEYDAKIAAVANENLGDHVRVANLLDCDPYDFDYVDVMHASPPCPNFSQAKNGNGETELDIDLARKVAQFIDVIKPQIFTLENVYQYRNSQSWAIIQNNLFGMGYWVSVEHVNAADYGVAQTRQRMIVRAVRGGWIPYLPAAQRWIGWYEAIADLIPTLPASQFAPWQLKRLPEQMQTLAFGNNAQEWGDSVVYESEPFHTVTAQTGGRARAFIVDNQNGSRPPTVKMADEPIMTVLCYDTKHPAPKAYAGRVIAMTPRALARFQSFPDWYKLPDSKTLAAKGIGNAVPPLLYQRIITELMQTV